MRQGAKYLEYRSITVLFRSLTLHIMPYKPGLDQGHNQKKTPIPLDYRLLY